MSSLFLLFLVLIVKKTLGMHPTHRACRYMGLWKKAMIMDLLGNTVAIEACIFLNYDNYLSPVAINYSLIRIHGCEF